MQAPKRPTAAEIVAYRERLGISAYRLAKLLGAGGTNTVRAWETGLNKAPSYLALALEQIEQNLTTERADRLEYLREQITNESISYGEIIELQGLADYIPADDMLLLEWAGKPEEAQV